MSVERMEMMNVIGSIGALDHVSMQVVRHGYVHIVNALNEINQNNFTIITPDQNTNVLKDLSFIKPYHKITDYSDVNDKLDKLIEIFELKKNIYQYCVEEEFNYNEIVPKIDSIYLEVKVYNDKLVNFRDELSKVVEFKVSLEHIRELKLDFEVLKNLHYFTFKIGRLSKENYKKLKGNIENISSIIYEISSIPGYHVVISVTPKVLEGEVDRIFKSLNYEELNIPYNLGGTPEDIIHKLDEIIADKENEIRILNDAIIKQKGKYATFIDESYSRIKIYEKAQIINSEIACTNEFFYMAGWVPVSEKKSLQESLNLFGNSLILIFKPKSQVNSSIIPPTRLKNNWFTRPFEALVNMYGIPSYNELDPTTFVAISYMIMFGFMFGDIGQGGIFLLAGLFLSIKEKRPNLGGILSRLGVSSMIFGALFGSIFGNEKIIKPLIIRPMENVTNMNAILIGGVVLGIAFTTIGFIYSLINAYKRRDIEDGLFGKNGLVGLIFYWITLLTALNIYKQGHTILPLPMIIVMLCILLALMVLKQPISNLINRQKPLYNESAQDYYIESGFGVVETLLSMLSNTISFIRVGAFALNHVGLFVAFATIANLMKNSAGSFAVLLLGNIIIISLEGLIVFIQGLRLEYYELFSKYYDGNGIEFNPVRLRYTSQRTGSCNSNNINQKPIKIMNM